MSIQKEYFGTLEDGTKVYRYKMRNKNGMEAHVLNIGAVLQSLIVPGKDGTSRDVVLGYADLEGYKVNGPNFGATIGRHANRIKDAKVVIDSVCYELEKNDGENNLHGGGKGYARVAYDVEEQEGEGKDTVTFRRRSPHMEQGFPGNLELKVSYTLTDQNQLFLRYEAVSDRSTVINLTNHSYFYLDGHTSGSVYGHQLKVYSDKITNTDIHNVPDGTYLAVEGTPFDFREYKEIGKDINAEDALLRNRRGYDHNYVLRSNGKELVLAAEVLGATSGLHMQVYTNMPGMQLYTANYLDPEEGIRFKEDAQYHSHDAVCLETQFYPNACNIKEFPSDLFAAGEKYDYTTIYQFV